MSETQDRRLEHGLEEQGGDRRAFARTGIKPKYARDRAIDVRHLRLEITPDFERRTIAGRCSTTFAPINDGVDAIELDAVELEIRSVSLLGEKKLLFDHDGQKLVVDLGSKVRSGEEATVVVEYSASPRRGLYFVGPDSGYPGKPIQLWSQGQDEDSRYWFPCYDYPNQKATSEVIATVPARFFALSNGRLVSAKEAKDGKTKTYHWHEGVPHVSYLITLVAGEYAEIRESTPDGAVPVAYYVPPGREADSRRSFANTPEMIRLFAEKLGHPFPYEKYAQVTVSDFIFGGMENTSATTLTENTLHDERAHLDFSSDGLVAHELAHQWFGDLITCRDWSHAWLNEGFATYLEAVWKEHKEGRDEALLDLWKKAHDYFEEDSGSYRRPIVTTSYDAPIDLFDRHLYEKGALVLHTLRTQLGDDLFWKGIRHYVARHKARSVITEDLARAFEEATGRNVDRFFAQWVYGAGYPEFKVTFDYDEREKMGRLRVQQTQAENPKVDPSFDVVIPVEVVTRAGKKLHRFAVIERDQTFHFPCAERPLLVAFDKGNGILKKLEFEKGLDALVYQIENDDDPMGRMRAAEGLGKLGSLAAVAALRKSALHDPFHGVQAAAAHALGVARGAAALAALLEAASISHPKARRAAVRAMGELRGEDAAAERLAAILENGDPSYFVEAEAARSLGATRSPRAFDALRKGLERPSFLDVVRSQCFAGFAELRDEKAIPIAREWTAYGRPEPARAAAALCLGKLGEGKDDVREHLVPLLDDPSFRMKLAVIAALGELRDAKAIGPLERLRARDLDGRIRRRAEDAIARIRAGRERSDEARKLREDVDRLADENRKLRDRIDRLEAKLGGGDPAKADAG